MFKRRKPEEPPAPPPARGHVIASGLADAAEARRHQRGAFEPVPPMPAGEADAMLAIPAVPETAQSQTSPVAPTPPQSKEPPSMSIQPSRQPTPTPTITPPVGVTPPLSRTPLAPARMPASSGDRRTLVVGRGISVQGSITDAERLVVEGTVEASSLNAMELQIAQGGVLKGQVEVEDAEISGLMDGILTVRGSLVVRSTGQITGEARCRRLQVEDGGQLSGKIGMITDANPAPAPAPHPPAEVSAG